MERAEEILAVHGIDGGLAANGGIDLRKQSRRNLHIVETAAHKRGGKTGKIADDPAAERHHDIGALDACRDERFTNSLEYREALRALARGYRHARCADPSRGKRGFGRRAVVACDRFVADDRSHGPRPQREDFLPQQRQLPAADDDVVAALAERDIDDDRIAGAQRRSHGRRSPCAGTLVVASAVPSWPASALTISSTILSCRTSRDCTVMSARA